jgi:RNA polymerase sigma factor (sigma-70 family)
MSRNDLTQAEIDGLVSKTLIGDRTAFRRIVLELEEDLRFLAGAFDVGEGLTEEIVQATFVTAYQKLASYRGGGAFRAWLRAIARNHILRALRDQRRFTDVPGAVLEEVLVQSGLDDIDRIDELDHQTRKLRSCLERLPPGGGVGRAGGVDGTLYLRQTGAAPWNRSAP